ncbi:HD domain-containing protein [bacterium]|nr:HD domain-containing protein [bacterium]
MIQKIGEFFIDRKLITTEELKKALLFQEKHKDRLIGSIFVDLDILSELDLLQYLSKRFRVQYITSEKLEKIPLNEHASDIIPLSIATKKNIFPLKHSFGNGMLSLLTSTPQDVELLEDLKVQLANVSNIVPVVALPKAIKALIAKQYQGDLNAFERIFSHTVDLNMMVPGAEKVISIDHEPEAQQPAHNVAAEIADTSKLKENTKMSLTQIANHSMASHHATVTETITGIIPGYDHKLATNDPTVIEIFRVFAGLFDSKVGREYRGHSQRVAILTQRVGNELSMTEVELYDLTIAALLHDIGKQYHMGTFDIAARLHADRLIKYANLPSRLFSTIKLSNNVKQYLGLMYETWNGRGFPNGLRLEEIPLGAQILQLAHTWDSLTYISNLPLEEAFQRIVNSNFFSAKLMDAFKIIQGISESHQVEKSKTVLIVARNVDVMNALDEKFVHAGYAASKCSRMSEAANAIKNHHEQMIAIVCDIRLTDDDITPMKLLKALKRKTKLAHIRFFFFSSEKISSELKSEAEKGGCERILESFAAEKSAGTLLSMINKQPR